MIKGIDVILYNKEKTSEDPFGRPIYAEAQETVHNVIVSPASAEAIVDELNLTGKHLVYVLCIPKGDAHDWEDRTVEFLGRKWKTFGPVQEWIEAMVPLSWNKQVKVETYGESEDQT